MPIGAAIGGAVLGAGASIYGSSQQSDAIDNASNAQQRAATMSIEEQRRQYEQTRTDQLPWLTTGGSALSSLAKLYGLDTYQNGQVQQGGQPGDMSDFFKSPDYQFKYDEGLKAIDAGAAARGSLDSGATRKAEIAYAGNLASGEFNSYANRLAGIAGVGQTSAQSIGQFGANAANNISNITQNQGDNMASSYLANGQVQSNMWGQLGGIGSGLLQNYGAFGMKPPGGSQGMFQPAGGSSSGWSTLMGRGW